MPAVLASYPTVLGACGQFLELEIIVKKITVIVNISEKDAIKAGLDTYGPQEVIVNPSELTERQRLTLAEMVSNPLNKLKDAQGNYLPFFSVDGLVDATQAQVQMLLDKAADAADEKERQFNAEVAKSIESILAEPMDDLISPSTLEIINVRASKFCYSDKQASQIMEDPRIQKRWAELKQRAADLRAARADEMERRKQEDLIEKEKKDAAQARRQAQLDAWVAESGSSMQKTRYARGLLPESEIIDGIRNAFFSPLDRFPRYMRISPNEVLKSYADIHDCADENDVIFSVDKPQAITDAQMIKVLTMEKSMDGLKVDSDIRLHAGVLRLSSPEEDEKYGVRRFSLRLTAQVGELTLSREYALV